MSTSCLLTSALVGAMLSSTPLLAQHGSEDAPGVASPSTPGVGSIADVMRKPLADDSFEEGVVWARTRTMRARFDADGAAILPVFGPSSPREWPIRLDLLSAEIGGVALDVSTVGAPALDGDRVVQERGDLVEVHHLGLDAIEQTFVLEAAPASGELVVRMGVETDLETSASRGLIEFAAPGLGRVTYGEAVLVDADGDRTPIERTWVGSGIEFRVPADLVAASTFPITIDPLWQSFSSDFGVADDTDPDIVYSSATDNYVAVWQEYTSAANSDVYATKFRSDFSAQSDGFAIEMSSEVWTGPAAAYAAVNDRMLVAASSDAGSGMASVRGRIFDVSAEQNIGAAFTVSSTGVDKLEVDVGGTTNASALLSRFCVVWSRRYDALDHDIEYRTVNTDGVVLGSIQAVDTTDVNDVSPAISKGLGDTSIDNGDWHIVFLRDNDGDGMGGIYAKRVYYTAFDLASSDVFGVDLFGSNSSPAVTSFLDDPVIATGERPAVVVYEKHYNDPTRPSGKQTDVIARVISGDQAHGMSILTVMEDFDRSLLQCDPVVATNGSAFFVAYLEEDYTAINGEQWDVYMATGEVVDTATGATIALHERHLPLGTTDDPEIRPDIVTRWEGSQQSMHVDGAAIWTRTLPSAPSGYGRLEGRRFDYAFANGSSIGAVGAQYCDANPNSVGDFGGRTSSWLTVLGNQSANSLHTAVAQDLPLNAFGFLLASKVPTQIANPGGSQGNICLAGEIGRFVGQLGSSGATGTIETTIDPQLLPQPTGFVSATVGETWRFQLWHRDSVGGQSTSNFTNACSVTFSN